MLRLFPDAFTGRVLVRQVFDERWPMELEWDRPCSQDHGAEEAWPILSASDEPNPTPQDLYEEVEERRRIQQLVAGLTSSRRREILLRYYGFDEKETGEDWTQEEIAAIYGVSGARVQQLISDALRKLRERLSEYAP